ncbi:DNA (cytosine-5)-methyltransferase 3B-like isoform X2 [Rhopalosiphum padi]|uniref:DNA (cytosine-5)-methyltransferase 3B-like isoform X2 n=1 Tax=Rhopalosiphum padi TaxID=40932 RepID=UPI00298D9CFE|nr:DNA (cytosine-5)-methyltransferase 3B-like isoform X2 [Rhopalosiphum padi]
MIINAEKQQGQIVWAKISKKSKLWAAMIISTKKMNLAYFEDQPGKTCVWWFGNDTMSQLRNNLIFEFKSEIKNGMSNLCGQREEGVKQAIKTKGKDIIISIAKDNANDGCCVCLTQKHTLVLCSFCIRAYCNECLEFYCDKKVLAKILADKTWKCFACLNTTILKTCRLVPRKTVDQLKNIYNLYPASTENNCIKEEIQEIHVLNYKDIQNNVPKALKNLEFPFKILEISYVNGDMLDNNKRNAKLVIQYYPNRENYNEDKFFDMNDCMKKFFSFLQIKNKMEALHGDRTIFWAFETSAAIKVSEQKIISRFIQTQPIIFGTNIDDVRQRSRFIWTNITILKDDIEEYTGQQIYLHQLPKYAGKRVKYNEDHKDMPWCYTSVHIILSNFIKNNVHRCK